MTWTRLSDNFDGLSIELSDAAFRTHVLALVWSNRTLTNGRLPARALGQVNGTPEIAAELETAGFWAAIEGGYQVDWADQEQAEQVQARKSRNAQANKAYRERRDLHSVGDHSKCDPKHCNASRDESRDASHDLSPSASVRDTRPDPTRPDPSKGESRDNTHADSTDRVDAPMGREPDSMAVGAEKAVQAVVVDEVAESFERAWKSWPKKADRKTALTRYRTAAKRRGLETLEADVIRFGRAYAQTAMEVKFVPGLAVWLNNDRWTDDLPTPSVPRMTRTEQNMAFVAQLAAEERGGGRPTRDDQNMAVVRRLEAMEHGQPNQRPTRGQEHLAYIASLEVVETENPF